MVRSASRRLLAILGVAALIGAAAPLSSAVAAPVDAVDIADTEATAETRSLYAYLLEQQGEGVLFGHQHTIDDGITFSAPNWEAETPNSDVYAGTGEYPAVFGWDTLILEGREKPGSLINPKTGDGGNAAYLAEHGAENAAAWAEGMIRAHELGGINTVSGHMYNFANDTTFADSSGRVVSTILPGGSRHAEFTAYLDLIALTADLTVDDDGTPIPIIFRPFHENTGSWFWWGAAHATAGEYKEIFRFTVEYLRDVKGVHNLLFAFSPNGSLSGDPDAYLATYPGDAWVDVLGYDAYDFDDTLENSDAYIQSVLTDLRMVTDLAAERGKIPAFTEFGRNGARTIKVSGNKSLTFYTDLIDAIATDEKAKRITYMQTWSNWGTEQFYVPYPAHGQTPEHEMYRDFLAFYEHPYTVFSAGVVGVYDRATAAVPAENAIRFQSPADGVRVLTPSPTVRVAFTGAQPERVVFDAVNAAAQELSFADGVFTGQWEIGEDDLDNTTVSITATADYADGTTSSTEATLILGAAPELPLGVVDDFETYGDDVALRAAYSFNNATSTDIALTGDPVGSGDHAVRFSYDFATRSYNGFGKSFEQDWSSFDQMNLWLDPDASGQKLVLQINTADGESFEAFPSLAADAPGALEVSFLDFRAKSDGGRPTEANLARTTSFWIYINEVGDFGASSIVVDDVMAVDGDAQPQLPPPVDPEQPEGAGVVDDFEDYADDAALRAAWIRTGASTLALSRDNASAGEFGAAFPYLDGFTEFGKVLGGADWSAFDELALWVQPDANERKIVLQLAVGDNSYDWQTVVAGGQAVELIAPFDQWRQSAWKGGDQSLRMTPAELAAASSLSIFIEPSSGGGVTGVYHFDAIRAQVEGGAPSEEPQPQEPAMAEDFEGYPDDAALRSAWNRNAANGLSLAEGEGNGDFAGAFAYDYTSQNYVDYGRYLGADWTGYDAVSMWVKPDGSGQKVLMQIEAGGVYYEASVIPEGAEAVVVTIPFAEMAPATFQNLDSSLRPTAAQLAAVGNLALFLDRGSSTATNGTYLFDDIQAVQTREDPEQPEAPGEPTPPAPGESGGQDPDPESAESEGGKTPTSGGRLSATGADGHGFVFTALAGALMLFTGAIVLTRRRRASRTNR